jgi:DNA-directed RNA polymerase specialized sigma24 family protein
MLQAAFRDLHGARLHGFALLVALGDRQAAAAASSKALSDAGSRLAELRHPERAAAWLRARVARSLSRHRRPAVPEHERRETLRGLGVTDAAFAGLATLSPRERAVFVAAAIERLEPIDVEQVAGRDPDGTARLVDRARRRYLQAAVALLDAGGGRVSAGSAPPGLLAVRVEAVASRTGLGAR